jgi:ATP-dependent Lhr-like helicase
VHEGIAQLWGLRFAKQEAATFSFAVNDYGLEIRGPKDYDFKALFNESFFNVDGLESEISESLQIGQLTQRQFRSIAQIAGLVFTGYPGQPKTGRQMQVSASLLYEVFKKHEPNNLLIKQSYWEVLHDSLESDRLVKSLNRMRESNLKWVNMESPSPLAFPLLVESIAIGQLSNESLEAKIARLRKTWEKKKSSTKDKDLEP